MRTELSTLTLDVNKLSQCTANMYIVCRLASSLTLAQESDYVYMTLLFDTDNVEVVLLVLTQLVQERVD